MTILVTSIAGIIRSRRFIASCIALLLLHDFYLYINDDDPQGGWNFLSVREDFSPVIGPSGFVVTGHQVEAMNSMIFVYLHKTSERDKPSNLIFRYDGDTPSASWTDSTHVVIEGELSRNGRPQTGPSNVSKQVAILDGIQISYIGFNTSQMLPGDKNH